MMARTFQTTICRAKGLIFQMRGLYSHSNIYGVFASPEGDNVPYWRVGESRRRKTYQQAATPGKHGLYGEGDVLNSTHVGHVPAESS